MLPVRVTYPLGGAGVACEGNLDPLVVLVPPVRVTCTLLVVLVPPVRVICTLLVVLVQLLM